MDDIDELDLLRQPGERAIWRDRPVASWRRALFLIALLFVWNVVNSLVNDVELTISATIFIAGVVGIALIGGGTAEPHTLVTEDRVLRLGKVRRFRSRRDPPYAMALAEIDRVSLRDDGVGIGVEIRHADTGKIDVLSANQPQALAAAIARGAACAEPPGVGRLAHVADVCLLLSLAVSLILLPWFSETVSAILVDGPIGERAASSVLLSALLEAGQLVGTVLPLIFVAVVTQSAVALFAMLAMPTYASAEEAAYWFSLKPSRRVYRWMGWKGRLHRWLASLAYRRDLDASAHGSAQAGKSL